MDPEDMQWEKVLNKKAIGIDEYDLGEVQEVMSEYIVARRHTDKKLFQVPKKLVLSFDGNIVIFNLNEHDAKSFQLKETKLVKERTIPSLETTETTQENMLYEKVAKAPTEETTQPNVQILYEELVIEQKRLSKPQIITDDISSNSKVNVLLKREEKELNKHLNSH